jgi:hypothetical protein
MTLYIQIVKSIKNLIKQLTTPTVSLVEESEKTGDLIV